MQTNINFPENLPPFLRDSYAISYTGNIIRSSGAGLSSQRQYQENMASQTSVSLLLTSAEAKEFEWFYKSAARSSKWFNANLKTPMGMDSIVCRFLSRYEGPRLEGCMWKYTFDLELYKQQVFSRDWFEFGKDFIENSDIFDIAMNREWPES